MRHPRDATYITIRIRAKDCVWEQLAVLLRAFSCPRWKGGNVGRDSRGHAVNYALLTSRRSGSLPLPLPPLAFLDISPGSSGQRPQRQLRARWHDDNRKLDYNLLEISHARHLGCEMAEGGEGGGRSAERNRRSLLRESQRSLPPPSRLSSLRCLPPSSSII